MKITQHLKARELRHAGYSLREIVKELKVAKSSVSRWVRDIELTNEQRQRLDDKIGENFKNCSQLWGRTQKKLYEERVLKAQKQGFDLAEKDSRFRTIAALYWGEGRKCSRYFSISNCDSYMIRLVFNWLKTNGYIGKVTFSVTYHEGGLTEKEITEWWTEKLPGITVKNLRKFIIKDTTNVKRLVVGKWPYGVARLSVHSSELFDKVMGGIEFLKNG